MTQVEMIKDASRYFDLFTSDSIEVQNARFVNDKMIAVQYVHAEDFVPSNAKTNVVLTAFTTAHARFKLYSILEQLERRVLYFDTDSIIYLSREDEWEPEIGDYLGELTSETGDKYITAFVSGGPKHYAHRLNDGKTCCKVRGITLNYRNSLLINL
ncbi:hypothetical protein QZH41_010248 [Actinostola sp. cb2023]|nr:hypothetical protein QZH41_010248 [Actinostola sp. cb2023]